MQRLLTFPSAVRTTQRLAIDRHEAWLLVVGTVDRDRSDPVDERFLKLLGLQQR